MRITGNCTLFSARRFCQRWISLTDKQVSPEQGYKLEKLSSVMHAYTYIF